MTYIKGGKVMTEKPFSYNPITWLLAAVFFVLDILTAFFRSCFATRSAGPTVQGGAREATKKYAGWGSAAGKASGPSNIKGIGSLQADPKGCGPGGG